MAISDFFQALARPEVQRQLAALSYAYGPQAMDNGVASRFANYDKYLRQQQKDLLGEQVLAEQLRAAKENTDLKKEKREREKAARARLDESLRGADLTSSLPSLEADLAGAGPRHGAAAPPQAILPSIAKYYSDIGDYGGAVTLYKNTAEMEAKQREAAAKQQAEAQRQAMIQQAIADPNVQQRLGPNAAHILSIPDLPGGIAKLLAPPPPSAVGTGGAGGIGAGPGANGMFAGKAETERYMNVVSALYPKYQAGTLTDEERRAFNMATAMVNKELQPRDPSYPTPDVLGLLGGTAMPAAGAPASGAAPTAGQPQEPAEGGRAPILGKTLAEVAGAVGGLVNPVQAAWGTAPVPFPWKDLPGNVEAQEARGLATRTATDLSLRIQQNPNYPEKQRKILADKIVRLDPELWSNEEAYRNEIVGTAQFIANEIRQAKATLTQNVPPKTRAGALAAVAELPGVLDQLGVHFASSKSEMEAAMKRARPGQIIVITDEGGNTKKFVVGED